MANIRTFIAIDLSDAQRQQAQRLIDKLSAVGGGFRWVEPGRMHITLNFLGEVAETEINNVCKLVRDVSASVSRFDFDLVGAGAFPSAERPRVIWAGVEQGKSEMVSLQAALADALAEQGYPPEARGYRPHLTLGRIKKGRRPDGELAAALAQLSTFRCGANDADQVVIYSSFLDRSGPEYTAISHEPLSG